MTAEVERTLQELGLQQYLKDFLLAGFEDWDSLCHITESDLAVLNVRLGHRRKLQRGIARKHQWPAFKPLPTAGSLQRHSCAQSPSTFLTTILESLEQRCGSLPSLSRSTNSLPSSPWSQRSIPSVEAKFSSNNENDIRTRVIEILKMGNGFSGIRDNTRMGTTEGIQHVDLLLGHSNRSPDLASRKPQMTSIFHSRSQSASHCMMESNGFAHSLKNVHIHPGRPVFQETLVDRLREDKFSDTHRHGRVHQGQPNGRVPNRQTCELFSADRSEVDRHLDAFIQRLNHSLYLFNESDLRETLRVSGSSSPKQVSLVELCLSLALGAVFNSSEGEGGHVKWYTKARMQLGQVEVSIDSLEMMRISALLCLYRIESSFSSSLQMLGPDPCSCPYQVALYLTPVRSGPTYRPSKWLGRRVPFTGRH